MRPDAGILQVFLVKSMTVLPVLRDTTTAFYRERSYMHSV